MTGGFCVPSSQGETLGGRRKELKIHLGIAVCSHVCKEENGFAAGLIYGAQPCAREVDFGAAL